MTNELEDKKGVKTLKITSFFIISFIGFFALFSSTMSKSPILPLFAKSLITLKFEEPFFGYIIAASTVPGILVSMIAGRLSDVYGRRKLILVSTIIFASAPILYLFAINIWILMIIRFYHGFSTAIFVPVAMAAIAESYPDKKGKYISFFSSITLVGRFLAPITGGAILFLTNDYYYGVYIGCVISGSIALALVVFLYRDRIPKTEFTQVAKKSTLTIKEFVRGFKEVLTHKIILSTSIVQASQYFAFGIVEVYVILHADSLHFDAWLIGLIPAILTLMLVVFKPLMGYFSDNIGRRVIILVGLLLGGGVSWVIPFTTNYIGVILTLCGFGIGMAMVVSSTAAYVSDLSKKEDYGTAIGTLSTIMDIGQTLGPILSGYVLIAFSFEGVFLMVSILLFISAIIFYIIRVKPFPD
ncbi:MAG: MFS transporter [Candidatus Lokiarchaeota archaeon]|nr:MFS transporter [Candidatus Lokiarchaeota archaeon]